MRTTPRTVAALIGVTAALVAGLAACNNGSSPSGSGSDHVQRSSLVSACEDSCITARISSRLPNKPTDRS